MHLGRFRISRHWLTVGLAALVASIAALLWPPFDETSPLLTPLYALEWKGYDALFQLRMFNMMEIDPDICIIGFNDNDAKSLGHDWPPPRNLHARVVNRLVEDGAKLIVFDVLFSGPDATSKKNDIALDAELGRARNVVLATVVERDPRNKAIMLHAPYYDPESMDGVDFERNASIGFVEVPVDNGVVRRCYPIQHVQGEWLPSLAVASYLKLKGLTPDDVRMEAKDVWLGNLRVPRTGPSIPSFDMTIMPYPIPSTYIDFPPGRLTAASGEFSNSFDIYGYDQVALQKTAPGEFKDKIVFIGITGKELIRVKNDKYRTSYTSIFAERSGAIVSGEIPGVFIHAQYLNALLHNGFIHLAPRWAVWLSVFIFSLLATWLARRYLNWRGPVFLALTLLAYLIFAIGAFNTSRTAFSYVIPMTMILLSAGTVAWLERGQLRRKWAGYVSPAVLEVILHQESEMGAKRQDASVIFGDIRAFTTFSEQHDPETVVRLLNRHFERLTKIIYETGGTIDKFLGDGILVVYGAPLPLENEAFRAVRASWLMREIALQPIIDNDGSSYTLATGFGITTGPLVAGHVGSTQRHEFTIIGDTVNLSSRLQGVTGQPDVIIDEPTYQAVRAHVNVESLGEVTLKGKAQPVQCYKVIHWEDEPTIVDSAESTGRI